MAQTDHQIIVDFIQKLDATINDVMYLKNYAVDPLNLAAIGKCNDTIQRSQEMKTTVIKLEEIEERYKNASDLWML